MFRVTADANVGWCSLASYGSEWAHLSFCWFFFLRSFDFCSRWRGESLEEPRCSNVRNQTADAQKSSDRLNLKGSFPDHSCSSSPQIQSVINQAFGYTELSSFAHPERFFFSSVSLETPVLLKLIESFETIRAKSWFNLYFSMNVEKKMRAGICSATCGSKVARMWWRRAAWSGWSLHALAHAGHPWSCRNATDGLSGQKTSKESVIMVQTSSMLFIGSDWQ